MAGQFLKYFVDVPQVLCFDPLVLLNTEVTARRLQYKKSSILFSTGEFTWGNERPLRDKQKIVVIFVKSLYLAKRHRFVLF